MRIFLDENLTNRRLKARIVEAGHDAEDVLAAGLAGARDEAILEYAAATGRAVLTADVHDRELVGVWESLPPPRPLVVLVFADNNSTPSGIAEALTNLESSGTPLRDRIEILVHWKGR